MQQSAAIILAGGSGRRMATGEAFDKLLLPLEGIPAWLWAWRAFEAADVVDAYWVVYRDAVQRGQLQDSLRELSLEKPVHWLQGGAERMDSVYAALTAIPVEFGYVFIHDGARPLVSSRALTLLANCLHKHDAAVLAHRPKDTLKRVADGVHAGEPSQLEDLDRSRLWAMETPQAFRLDLICKAYAYVRKQGISITDDTAAMEHIEQLVAVLENPDPNPKLTTPDDLSLMLHLLAACRT